MRRIPLLAAVVALAAAVLASAAWSAATGPATVKTRTTKLGRVLVTSSGRTLYLFKADRGRTSACTGACATAWPPLLTKGAPKAASGATGSMLGTTRRPNGSMQVTYNGHPLYLFKQDKKAGDTTGQGVNGFGARWYVLSAGGKTITKKNPTTSSTPTTPTTPTTTPAPPGY
jgi:predicted lipoprotein with Yx(FWY)xxD motif